MAPHKSHLEYSVVKNPLKSNHIYPHSKNVPNAKDLVTLQIRVEVSGLVTNVPKTMEKIKPAKQISLHASTVGPAMVAMILIAPGT